MTKRVSAKISAEKVKELALDYTKKRMQSTVILLLYNIGDLQDEQYFSYEFDMPEQVKACIDFIADTIKNIDVTLLRKSEDRQNTANKIAEQKDTLISLAKCLYSYQDMLEDVAEGLQTQFISKGLERTLPVKVSRTQFIGDCMDFIESSPNGEHLQIYMTEIMRCFPVKMSREKYFDYIKQALSEFFANFTGEFADNYARYILDKVSPQGNQYYGKYFDGILNDIEKFRQYNLEGLKEDEIQGLFDRILDTHDETEALTNDLNIVFEALNYLQIIFTFADDLDRFLEDSFILKDAFYTTVNALRSDEYEFFEDNLSKMFDEQTVIFVDSAAEAYKKFSHALKKLGMDNADDELSLILAAIDAIDDIFYSDMQQNCFEFMSKNSIIGPKADASASGKAIDYFLSEMKKRLEEMPNKQQKRVKQKLAGLVPCPLSPDDFAEYISNAFDDAADFTEQVIMLEKVGQVFEKYNYNQFNGEDEHEHLHEHDEHCGCEDH